MKKTVILILAILPIFLVITISFAGKILSIYQHIDVERVAFVDDDHIDLSDDAIIVLGVGEEKEIKIRVYPDLASNKNVQYTVQDETICTVDENGVATGHTFGSTTIIVKTQEGSKVDMIIVKVTQDKVIGVSLPYDEIELTVGESKNLTASVEAIVALNKKVFYSSSDTDVARVDANGKVTAMGAGEAIITVITDDGGFTDSCRVICKQGLPALAFNFEGDDDFTKMGDVYACTKNKINLLNYLVIDEKKVIINDVKFKIQFGNKIASLEDGVLTITGKGIVTIVAYVGDEDNPTYQTDLRLGFQ